MSLVAAPFSVEPPVPAEMPVAVWLSQRVHAVCFFVLLCWPYSLIDRQLSVAMLVAVSVIALLNQPLRLPRLSPMLVVFLCYFALVLGLQVLGGGLNPFALSQSNHIIQFAIYYFAFAKIVQGCDWTGIITSRRFLIAAAALSGLYYCLFALAPGGNESDLNITLLALLLGLFIRGRDRSRLLHFAVMLVISTIVIATSDRSSVVLMLGVVLFLFWFPLPPRTTGLVVAIVLLLPVAFYLLIDNQTVLWLYKLDHNTGIRAEFIRGAASLLQQSPLWGTGFGGPYRPVNFPYLSAHPYLRDLATVHTISNHHSLFDVALRLGIPAALVFSLGIFRSDPGQGRSPAYQVLCVAAAVGLSFNAMFENQGQLPQLVLIVLMLQEGSTRYVPPSRRVSSSTTPDALVPRAS